ncbi:hypothetical protein [Thalassotalea profundi]|uniref:Tail fiber protein n=1 Tax=Thalassotalea profundi TaxID=2036687 RepID=A0ABQ3IR14_9GAMM|nr:hypothetical protein [Thalassotalea profundi]GHE87488.1 hypothetical protein GCM10011501_16210 [Thalassotalea profundi]
MALINSAVNIKKLLDDQQVAINVNTDAKASVIQSHVSDKTAETKSHVTTKATDTKTSVNDNTNSETLELDNAVAGVAAGVDALPAHITSEVERVISGIPSAGAVSSIQRGSLYLATVSGRGFFDITIADLGLKGELKIISFTTSSSATDKYKQYVYLHDSSTIRVINEDTSNVLFTMSWEAISYV